MRDRRGSLSIPGRSGRIGAAPGERISASYRSSYSVWSARLRTVTVLASRSMYLLRSHWVLLQLLFPAVLSIITNIQIIFRLKR